MHRRSFLAGASIASAGLAGHGAVLAAAARPRLQRGFVGCYTTGQGPKDLGVHPAAEGIYTFTLDPATGKGSDFRLAARCASPTNLLLHPDGRKLYAARGGNFAPGESATWTAYRIGRGGLTELNSAAAGGVGPTHGMIDRRGRFLVTTNFSSNEVVAIRLGRDGRLGEIASRIISASQPSGPPPPPGTPLPPLPAACSTLQRTADDQCRTKPHIALFSPRENWVVVAEIATDLISTYRFDRKSGALTLHDVAHGQEGGGPRHLVWSPDGRFLYSSDEHGSQASAWSWDERTGKAQLRQTLSTLPADFKARNTTAHIAIHPSGRSLWVSNRGHPSIACFRIDQTTGLMTAAGHAPSGGRDCWCFDIDATGRWLIAGNVTGDFLAIYAIDPVSAALTMQPERIPAPFPTCVRMAA